MASAGLSRGAQLLEKWRGKATQLEACELLKLDPATYSRLENGVRKPHAQVSFRIELMTNGKVPAKSWWEPPIETPVELERKTKAARS